MKTEAEVRAIVREKMADGRLPRHGFDEPCPGNCKFCDGPNER